jgi:hypothetical protein
MTGSFDESQSELVYVALIMAVAHFETPHR